MFICLCSSNLRCHTLSLPRDKLSSKVFYLFVFHKTGRNYNNYLHAMSHYHLCSHWPLGSNSILLMLMLWDRQDGSQSLKHLAEILGYCKQDQTPSIPMKKLGAGVYPHSQVTVVVEWIYRFHTTSPAVE